MNEELIQLNSVVDKLVQLNRRSFGEQGCTFMSGATTITGYFSGFSVGATKPDSIVLTTSDTTYTLNGTTLAADDNIVGFVTEGEYVPIQFTSITTTGSGYLKLWHK